MKTYYECLPCLLRQTIEATRLVIDSPTDQEKILRKILAEMAKIDMSKSPPHMTRQIHKYIKEFTQVNDPYREIKKEFNKLALTFCKELSHVIQCADNPFETAVKISIAGNIIDFGVRADITKEEVWETLQDCIKAPVRFNSTEELHEAVLQSSNILFLADNAGEIVFDRLLLEMMPIHKVTYAVRGKPIINDATMEDAYETGICDLLRVIDNGSDAPGTILEICSPTFQKEFESADLIIAKGQGNYETLSQLKGKRIFSLLKVKCPVIAYDLGCSEGELVLKSIS